MYSCNNLINGTKKPIARYKYLQYIQKPNLK